MITNNEIKMVESSTAEKAAFSLFLVNAKHNLEHAKEKISHEDHPEINTDAIKNIESLIASIDKLTQVTLYKPE